MAKKHPDVNYYRSAKNPSRQVVVAKLAKDIGGGYLIGVVEGLQFHQVIVGQDLTEQEESGTVKKA